MLFSLPIPGAALEEVQRTMVKGNVFPGLAAEDDHARGPEAAGSRFSRVLAGKMDSTPGDARSAESAPDKGPTSEVPPDREPQKLSATSSSAGREGRLERSSVGEEKASSTIGETGPQSALQPVLAEELGVWSGLGLMGMVPVPTASAGRLISGPVWQDGLPVELKTRLATEIAAHYTNRGGLHTLTVKLEPEHLGKLDIQFQARGNHLEVRFLAANRESEAALRENLKELTETIQRQSGRFQQVEVRVDLKQNQNPADRSGEDTPGHSPHGDSRGENRRDQDPSDEPTGREAEARTAGSEDPVQGG